MYQTIHYLSGRVIAIAREKETPEKLTFHVTECLWAKTFKELDAADIGYTMICHSDLAAAKARHPNLKMERTKTMMRGDNYCNLTYAWEE